MTVSARFLGLAVSRRLKLGASLLQACLACLLLATQLQQASAAAQPADASTTITKLLDGLAVDTPKEYDRIPDIWRPAIAAGKRNDAAELKRLLELSLPKADEPLHHWQAVVIGGGIINGLSIEGVWPERRIKELLKDDAAMMKRWNRVLELADKMADDEKVPPGTRYDALRILGVDSFEKQGKHLEKYLTSSNDELQMGAISGLSDVESPRATAAILASFKNYKGENREIAINALLRTDERKAELLKAIEAGKIDPESLNPEQAKKLKSGGRDLNSKQGSL